MTPALLTETDLWHGALVVGVIDICFALPVAAAVMFRGGADNSSIGLN